MRAFVGAVIHTCRDHTAVSLEQKADRTWQVNCSCGESTPKTTSEDEAIAIDLHMLHIIEILWEEMNGQTA